MIKYSAIVKHKRVSKWKSGDFRQFGCFFLKFGWRHQNPDDVHRSCRRHFRGSVRFVVQKTGTKRKREICWMDSKVNHKNWIINKMVFSNDVTLGLNVDQIRSQCYNMNFVLERQNWSEIVCRCIILIWIKLFTLNSSISLAK